jgi:serine/threonine protein kinase
MQQPLRFGKYTLLERISVGGMAEVFRAKAADGKLVAIKRILPNVAEDAQFIKMFVEEARISGQLVHPNICRIYELGRQDGTHFIAMEYIRGKDLIQVRNRLRKIKEPMPLKIVVGILTKALEGLDYAHKKRDGFARPLELVHRDCSPHNLLMSYDGEVKVIDFGIAKAKRSVMKSQAGVLKGKFAYMSPEQVIGKPIDRRSDIFACGVILYELVTGERLFTGDSDFAILEKVRKVEITPARDIDPTIPPAIESVIMKALAVDRDKRYQWCSDMKADLDRYGGGTTDDLAIWIQNLFAPEVALENDATSPAPVMAVSTPASVVAPPLPPPAPPPAAPERVEPEAAADDGELPVVVEPPEPEPMREPEPPLLDLPAPAPALLDIPDYSSGDDATQHTAPAFDPVPLDLDAPVDETLDISAHHPQAPLDLSEPIEPDLGDALDLEPGPGETIEEPPALDLGGLDDDVRTDVQNLEPIAKPTEPDPPAPRASRPRSRWGVPKR